MIIIERKLHGYLHLRTSNPVVNNTILLNSVFVEVGVLDILICEFQNNLIKL